LYISKPEGAEALGRQDKKQEQQPPQQEEQEQRQEPQQQQKTTTNRTHLVDLDIDAEKMKMWLQTSDSILPKTDLPKFGLPTLFLTTPDAPLK
jgi:hypothetical protein